MDIAIVLFVQKMVGISPVINTVGIFCASVFIWIMIALVAVFFIIDWKKRWLAVISAIVSSVVAWLINQGIGELFFRPRPFAMYADVQKLIYKSSLEKSFPSDHTAVAFALAFAVFWVNRRWGTGLLILAALVAFGRVFVGVHYPSDVFAGALIGIICAYIIHCLVHKVLHTKHHPEKSIV